MENYNLTTFLKAMTNATSNNKKRYGLGAVMFRNNHFIATDGHILAKRTNPFEETTINAKQCLLPVKEINSAYNMLKNDGLVGINLTDGKTCFSGQSGTINSYSANASDFPKEEEVNTVIPKNPPKTRIAINPEILVKLAKALEAKDGLILEIGLPLDPIKVINRSDPKNGDIGVIMPMRITE